MLDPIPPLDNFKPREKNTNPYLLPGYKIYNYRTIYYRHNADVKATPSEEYQAVMKVKLLLDFFYQIGLVSDSGLKIYINKGMATLGIGQRDVFFLFSLTKDNEAPFLRFPMAKSEDLLVNSFFSFRKLILDEASLFIKTHNLPFDKLNIGRFFFLTRVLGIQDAQYIVECCRLEVSIQRILFFIDEGVPIHALDAYHKAPQSWLDKIVKFNQEE